MRLRRARRQKASGARLVAWCRGEGLGYAAIQAQEWLPSLCVSATTGEGVQVPCAVYPVESAAVREAIAPGSEALWVVVVPLLSVPVTLCAQSEGMPVCEVTLGPLASKLESKSLSLRKPQVAAALRGFERRYGAGRAQVSIDQVWPAEGDDVVWRIRATFPGADVRQSPASAQRPCASPSLRLYDDAGNELSSRVVVMEDQLVSGPGDGSLARRLVTFSCRLPESVRSFYAVASDDASCALDFSEPKGVTPFDSTPFHSGFDGMNAPRAAGMLEGIRALIGQNNNDAAYAQWFEEHRATPSELERQRLSCAARFGDERPTFGLVVPVADSLDGLAATIGSIRRQTYDRWNVCVVCEASRGEDVRDALSALGADERVRVQVVTVRQAHDESVCPMSQGLRAVSGDYVGVMGCGDTLEPDALWHFSAALVGQGLQELAEAAYCDEDRMDGARATAPSFKTFPNYGRLYGSNYVGRLLVLSRRVLQAMDLPSAQSLCAQEYDLALKTFEHARKVVHVPRVLYHRQPKRQDGDCLDGFMEEKRVLAEHLERRGIAAQVDEGPLEGTYRVHYCLPDPAPLVSVVIPTRDQSHLLGACVDSMLHKTTYPNYEVVLVENNSREPQTFALYNELCTQSDRVRVVTWTSPEPGAFNYSAIVNYGVSQTAGEFVVLLNNDTEMIEPRWLEEMLGCLMRPEVGVVGAKLLFGDGLIQHVGMLANPEGNFCHVCQNLTREAPGPGGRALLPGDLSMVTGACQMVRRSVFDELGGYDEDLAVGYNDGDFCLRARDAGYSVTLAPYALLHHREFSTRGRESTDTRLRKRFLVERSRMMQKHADFFAQGDPAMNPNLDPFGSYFEL